MSEFYRLTDKADQPFWSGAIEDLIKAEVFVEVEEPLYRIRPLKMNRHRFGWWFLRELMRWEIVELALDEEMQ